METYTPVHPIPNRNGAVCSSVVCKRAGQTISLWSGSIASAARLLNSPFFPMVLDYVFGLYLCLKASRNIPIAWQFELFSMLPQWSCLSTVIKLPNTGNVNTISQCYAANASPEPVLSEDPLWCRRVRQHRSTENPRQTHDNPIRYRILAKLFPQYGNRNDYNSSG